MWKASAMMTMKKATDKGNKVENIVSYLIVCVGFKLKPSSFHRTTVTTVCNNHKQRTRERKGVSVCTTRNIIKKWYDWTLKSNNIATMLRWMNRRDCCYLGDSSVLLLLSLPSLPSSSSFFHLVHTYDNFFCCHSDVIKLWHLKYS